MTSTIPSYESYQDSEIEYLGLVPKAWKRKQLKRSLEGCVNGIWGEESKGGDEDIAVIRVADFDRQRLGIRAGALTLRAITTQERERRLLEIGDLLIEKSGGGEKTPVGQVVLFGGAFQAVCSNFVARMRPRKRYDSRYLNYVFSVLYQAGVNVCSIKQNTGIQNLDSNRYLSECWVFPTLLEQKQIAGFLNSETAKIDALIEKQQQLIDLLEEKRQAVISHAVTKGLNPDVPMRDSGVEWLGGVPSHWIVCDLGKLTNDMCDGPFGSGLKSEHYKDSGVRVVRLQNIKSNSFWGGSKAYIDQDYYENSLSDHSVDPRDLLVAGLGDSNNPVGRACVAPASLGNAMVKADCFRFRLNRDKCVPEFLGFQLSAGALYVSKVMSNGSTRSRIPLKSMAKRKVAYCSMEEQEAIVEMITSACRKLQQAKEKAGNGVELLKERRTALISAAVTGKIDVRNWKPPTSDTEATP